MLRTFRSIIEATPSIAGALVLMSGFIASPMDWRVIGIGIFVTVILSVASTTPKLLARRR